MNWHPSPDDEMRPLAAARGILLAESISLIGWACVIVAVVVWLYWR